jgi:hypothetical protein
MKTTLKPEGPKPFRHAAQALFEKYGYADWALVVRAVDGQKESFWDAGDGKNPIGDRERAGLLYFEMAELQESIVQFCKPKKG